MFLYVPGIQIVHSLCIWALAAHLVITPGFFAQNDLHSAAAVLRAKYKFYEMTLHTV